MGREKGMAAVNMMRCNTKTYARRKTYSHNNAGNKKNIRETKVFGTNMQESKRLAVEATCMAYAPHRRGGGGGGNATMTPTRRKRSLSAVHVNPAVTYGRQKMSVRAMGNPNTTGIFAPVVRVVRSVMGVKSFNKLRGKGIQLHSQVITEFCKTIGAPAKVWLLLCSILI